MVHAALEAAVTQSIESALIATERLSLLPDGRLLYRLKRRWRDGTSHVIFEPLELVEKLGCGGSSATIVLDGHAK
jgi:hypothetical protein